MEQIEREREMKIRGKTFLCVEWDFKVCAICWTVQQIKCFFDTWASKSRLNEWLYYALQAQAVCIIHTLQTWITWMNSAIKWCLVLHYFYNAIKCHTFVIKHIAWHPQDNIVNISFMPSISLLSILHSCTSALCRNYM